MRDGIFNFTGMPLLPCCRLRPSAMPTGSEVTDNTLRLRTGSPASGADNHVLFPIKREIPQETRHGQATRQCAASCHAVYVQQSRITCRKVITFRPRATPYVPFASPSLCATALTRRQYQRILQEIQQLACPGKGTVVPVLSAWRKSARLIQFPKKN